MVKLVRKGEWSDGGRTRSSGVGVDVCASAGLWCRSHGEMHERIELESCQIGAAKKLLGARKSVASCAVRGELGWRMVEERYDEAKLKYYMRLKGMDDTRLAKELFLVSIKRRTAMVARSEGGIEEVWGGDQRGKSDDKTGMQGGSMAEE